MNLKKLLQLIACVSSALVLGSAATVSFAQQSMKVSDGGMTNGKVAEPNAKGGSVAQPKKRTENPTNTGADNKAVRQATPPKGTEASTPLKPAKKIDPPKELAGKKELGGVKIGQATKKIDPPNEPAGKKGVVGAPKIGQATAINAKPSEGKTK